MKASSRRACFTCCCLIVALLIAIAVAVIILRVLLKPQDVKLHVQSVTLRALNTSFSLPRLRLELTLEMDMALDVYNPNRASFSYGNSTVFMFYHGDEAARTFVPAGVIPARAHVVVRPTLAVDANKVIFNRNTRGDIRNDTLPITTRSEIKGRVNLWNVYRHRMTSLANCAILLGISNRTVLSYQCSNRNIF